MDLLPIDIFPVKIKCVYTRLLVVILLLGFILHSTSGGAGFHNGPSYVENIITGRPIVSTSFSSSLVEVDSVNGELNDEQTRILELHRYRRHLMMTNKNQNSHIPLVFKHKSPAASMSRNLQSDWSGYDGDQRVYTKQSAFSKADLCSESVCTSLYIFSTKAPSSNNISLSVRETQPDRAKKIEEIFRNVRSEDKGVAAMNTFKQLDFSIFDASGPSGQDYFYFEGTISFPEITRSSALVVLSDSPYSYLWMISDASAQTKCVGYNGSIIFNNAVNSGETVYIQAQYASTAYTKNNIYDNGNKSDCKWLEFGVDTNSEYQTVSFLEPICQDGPVIWNFYTSMECREDRKFASKVIDTNFDSHYPIDSGGNTVYCVVTDNSGNSNSDEAVTCIGGMDFYNTSDIYNAPAPLPPFYTWYAEYGRVVMGTIFGACGISMLFYISWLRRAEEGDVVLYRLNAVIEKNHPDDEENQQGKREYSNKTISWYEMLRQKKEGKKQYGIAVVVRGKRSLQLRPLRRLVGYSLDVAAIQSKNELNIARAPSTEIVKSPNGELLSAYEYKGGADSSPEMWAMVEEEDDHTILDMSMFSIHSVLWNVTRGVFIEKKEYEELNNEEATRKANEVSSFIDGLTKNESPSASPNTGVRRRNRKRVGVLSDGKNVDLLNSNKKVKEMRTPKKHEEIPLLLDFDDIADMTDTIEENELHGIRGFFIHSKLDWDSVDVLTSMRLDDYVLSSSVTALSASELFELRCKRIMKFCKRLFTFKRHSVAALDKPGDIDLVYREDVSGQQDSVSSPSPSSKVAPIDAQTPSTSGQPIDHTQVTSNLSLSSKPSPNKSPSLRRQAMDFIGVKSPLVQSPAVAPKRMGPIIPPIPSPRVTPQQLTTPLPLNTSPTPLMINQESSATPASSSSSPKVPFRKATLYDKSILPKIQPSQPKEVIGVDHDLVDQKYKEKTENEERDKILYKVMKNTEGKDEGFIAELRRQNEVANEITHLEKLQSDLVKQKEAILLEEERLKEVEKQKSLQQRMDTLQRLQSGSTVTGASPQLLAQANETSQSKLHIDTSMDDDVHEAVHELNLLTMENDKADEHRGVSSTSMVRSKQHGKTKRGSALERKSRRK